MGSQRVLVADNDEKWATDLAERLRSQGLEVDLATEITALESFLAHSQYGVVVVPMYLPERDYFYPVEVASRCCSGKCPFVVVSHLRSETNMETAYQLGANRVLQITVDVNEPTRIIKRILAGKR